MHLKLNLKFEIANAENEKTVNCKLRTNNFSIFFSIENYIGIYYIIIFS